MKFSLTKSSVIHPFLFAVIPVLLLVSLNIDYIHFVDIISSILVIILIVGSLWYLSNLLLKNKMKSGLIVSLGLVLFFMYGHIFNIFNNAMIGDFEIGRHRYLMGSFLMILGVGLYSILKTKKNFAEFTTIVNVIAIVLILVSVSNITVSLVENSFIEIADNNITFDTLSASALGYTPNVYYIILDEYTNSKVLKELFNFDNQDFISELESRGFHVDKNSHSNYPQTSLSVTSSLNMEYLNYLADTVGIDSSDSTLRLKLWNDNKISKIFKSLNYTVVHTPIYPNTITSHDYQLCPYSLLSGPFHILLWESTILYPPLSDIPTEHSRTGQVLCKFSELSDLHNVIEEPFFVYAHFLSPHAPFVFGPNGEIKQPKKIIPGNFTLEDKNDYVEQIQFINKKTIETIDTILLESTSPPIIILQGDHGTRSLFTEPSSNWHHNPSDAAIQERMSILNAYYLPDQNNELIYDGITPVNSFRLILNEYFNGDFELLDDKNYFSDYGYPYNFTDVTAILATNSPMD